jgi:hypothetical protein
MLGGKKRKTGDVRKLLRKLAGADGITVLNALFARVETQEQGVDGERFRIDFEGKREELHRLCRLLFVKESFDPRRTYRLTSIGLALVDDDRATNSLALFNRTLAYLRTEYGKQPGRQITLKEVSEALAVSQAQAAQALDLVCESPASASRSIGYPNEPEWYIQPGEQSLDYPDLDAVLAQMAEWAQRASWGPKVERNGKILYLNAPRAWIAAHKKLATAIGAGLVAIVGFLGDALDLFSSIARLFGAG